MNYYKVLSQQVYSVDKYRIVPIRYEDRFDIMNWRNTQIDLLRQQAPLTKKQQDNYFETTVTQLFDQEKPSQILWSFLYGSKLIGYGGLVHIDWEAKHGEISFLLCNERNADVIQFEKDWSVYLQLITDLAFNELKFNKIHTYAYNIRDYYFEVMYEQGFIKEAQLRDHILINGKLTDILILSKFNK